MKQNASKVILAESKLKEKQRYSLAETAVILGLPVPTIRRLALNGELRSYRFSHRGWWVRHDDLVNFIEHSTEHAAIRRSKNR